MINADLDNAPEDFDKEHYKSSLHFVTQLFKALKLGLKALQKSLNSFNFFGTGKTLKKTS